MSTGANVGSSEKCGAEWVVFGMKVVCEKEAGHLSAFHGEGPFVEYTTEWPVSDSPDRGGQRAGSHNAESAS